LWGLARLVVVLCFVSFVLFCFLCFVLPSILALFSPLLNEKRAMHVLKKHPHFFLHDTHLLGIETILFIVIGTALTQSLPGECAVITGDSGENLWAWGSPDSGRPCPPQLRI
jgi:hypothetical protein